LIFKILKIKNQIVVMNFTQLLLASSTTVSETNSVVNGDTLIYFGALFGFIWGLLVLATIYICKKKKLQTLEVTEVTI
jgi:hypothetical protein